MDAPANVGEGTYTPAGAIGTTRLVIENNNAISTTKNFTVFSPGSLVFRDISGAGLTVANNLNINGTGYANQGAIQNWAGINGGSQ